MVVSNTKKPHSLPLLAFSITIFLFLLNRVHSLTDTTAFFFYKFEADQEDVILEGDATTRTRVLQLTNLDTMSVSKAIYRAPFHLWKSPSNVASFETNFTFVISSSPDNPNTPADGFTFFIASLNISSGGSGPFLGLFPGEMYEEEESVANKIVAIEFDTFPDNLVDDPNYRHIGIDVNSIRSKATTKWEWQDGKVATARINYNSTSKILTATAYYDNSSNAVSVSDEVELNMILPQYVKLGFSASTGQFKEKTTILSWSFRSNLKYS